MSLPEGYGNNIRSNSVPPQRDTRGGNTGDYTGAYRGSYSADGRYSPHQEEYYSDDSWSSDNRSPVIGTGRDASPLKHPGTPLPKPSLKQQSSTDDSAESTLRSCKSIYIILLAIIFATSILLLGNNQPPTVVIDPNYPTPDLIPPPINWWNRYNNKCCLISNATGIYGRTTGDCTADGQCHDYLESWLLDHNQTFYNSTWSNRCCYEFRPIGSKHYKTFCSYTCLNTEKTKQVFL